VTGTLGHPVEVTCYSGHTYAQEPRAITWHGQHYEVKNILKRWRTPQGPGFRVQVEATTPHSTPLKLVDLNYIETQDRWTMTVQT
jgi:hypothetical protein